MKLVWIVDLLYGLTYWMHLFSKLTFWGYHVAKDCRISCKCQEISVHLYLYSPPTRMFEFIIGLDLCWVDSTCDLMCVCA